MRGGDQITVLGVIISSTCEYSRNEKKIALTTGTDLLRLDILICVVVI